MKKGDLITSVAQTTKLSHPDCEQIVHIMVDTIVHALANGNSVQIHGFGTFSIRQSPTTDPDPKKPAKEPVFTPGKVFREALKKNHSR